MSLRVPRIKARSDHDDGVGQTSARGQDRRALDEVVNAPPSGFALPDLGEIIRHRELLFFLTWRDVKVRYKQTVLGAGWAILQPLLTMLIFSLIFGRLAKIDSGGVPYPVFAFTALVPWTFFAGGVTQSSNSLVQNERLITKVYLPRLIIPIAAVVGLLIDLALSSVVLVALLIAYGVAPSVGVVALPLFIALAVISAIGAGTFLASLNVRYRDIRYIVPFLVQIWLFITPVAYATALVPDDWRFVYALNPMVGVIDGFRWGLLGADAPGLALLASVGSAIALLSLGMFTFRRLEDTFADEV